MVLPSLLRTTWFKRISSSLAQPRQISSHFSMLASPTILYTSRPKLGSNRPLSSFTQFPNISTTITTTASLTNHNNNASITSAYQFVRIHCRRDVADVLSEALLCFGANSASIDESENRDENEEICLSSIFTECQDVGDCIWHAADSIGLEKIPRYEVVTDEDCDWIQKTQESFHPVEVTEDLWIVPQWMIPPDARATNIILNPGLAFGTGDHPTTKLCLLLLCGSVKGGELFLDYGTGSGILVIAAQKLGASLSVGIDTDTQAITSAYQNATLNNIGPEEMKLFLVPSTDAPELGRKRGNEESESSNGDVFLAEKEKYDIVIANILLNPLLELADQIVAYAKPGGIVGLSGILCEQVSTITDTNDRRLDEMSAETPCSYICHSGKGSIPQRLVVFLKF
ncbi:hypothetical protein Sjap_000313 [Stephania japonica]|uniref:ETFB lysine methyltransferase n=1 Tax=Stephania japonica TaxID=461633 RepID=A0AAP0KHR9_9MAGN